jgi:hypothetical protein
MMMKMMFPTTTSCNSASLQFLLRNVSCPTIYIFLALRSTHGVNYNGRAVGEREMLVFLHSDVKYYVLQYLGDEDEDEMLAVHSVMRFS